MSIKIDRTSADGSDESRGREPGGLANRIGRISSAPPPSPKGKGIVLLLLGLAMIYALVDTFMLRGSSAGRVIEENHAADPGDNPPVAPHGDHPSDGLPPPGDPVDQGPSNGLPPPGDPVDQDPSTDDLQLPGADIQVPEGLPVGVERELRLNLLAIQDLARTIELSANAALRDLPKVLSEVPTERKAEVRGFILLHLARVAKSSRFRSGALEAAAWLAPDVAQLDAALFELIRIAMQDGMRDDRSAPAAIALLGSLPDRGGAGAVGQLDEVILDPTRPLHIRVEAARVRPTDGRSQAMRELAKSPDTHPALRTALGAEVR